MVDYYVIALKSNSETEIAAELYKILELLEHIFGGEKETCRIINYPPKTYNNLHQNLNFEKRHISEKVNKPKRKMSIAECMSKVRALIEKYHIERVSKI